VFSNTHDFRYRHLHLDDCWAATERNATGHIQADPARFPGGMKEVADYVHSKQLVFGLCAPCPCSIPVNVCEAVRRV
jgi:hypothetical protein